MNTADGSQPPKDFCKAEQIRDLASFGPQRETGTRTRVRQGAKMLKLKQHEIQQGD